MSPNRCHTLLAEVRSSLLHTHTKGYLCISGFLIDLENTGDTS
jgi:hypothetical protein